MERALLAQSLWRGLLGSHGGSSGFDLPTPITIAQVLNWPQGTEPLQFCLGPHTNFYGLKARVGNFNFFSDGTNSADVGALNDDLDLLRREKQSARST